MWPRKKRKFCAKRRRQAKKEHVSHSGSTTRCVRPFARSYHAAKSEPNANATLASRLPKWLQSAKNRDRVLRAVRRLEAKLAS